MPDQGNTERIVTVGKGKNKRVLHIRIVRKGKGKANGTKQG